MNKTHTHTPKCSDKTDDKKSIIGLRSSGMLRGFCWCSDTGVSELPIGHIFKRKAVPRPLKMGPTGCPETSLSN
jgi:hypothetical protein